MGNKKRDQKRQRQRNQLHQKKNKQVPSKAKPKAPPRKPATVQIIATINWFYAEPANEAAIKILEETAIGEATQATWEWLISEEEGEWDDEYDEKDKK